MADCILMGNGGGSGGGGSGDVTLFTSAEWRALSTAQKQSYGLVAIQESFTGYKRGKLVNGADYMPVGIYLPYSTEENVICEAYGDIFSSGAGTWGEGSAPVTFELNGSAVSPSLQADNSVFIPVSTNNVFAYVDLGGASVPFTVYVVMKVLNPSTYSRVLSVFQARGYAEGIMFYGSPVIVSRWGDSINTGVSSTDYFVGALQFDGGSAFASVRGYGIATEQITQAGRYVTLGRTDINPSTSNAEPCDVYVKYIAVVNTAETSTVVNANIENLYNVFLAE